MSPRVGNSLGDRADAAFMTISGYSDVDGTEPDRLVRALDRRSSASLYEPYRAALMSAVADTTGPVLDVGAGGGHLVERLLARQPGRVVLGVDPSHELTRTALAAGRPVLVGTGAALPFPSASIGCLVAERVLQHVAAVEDALHEMARVAARGATLVLADPDHGRVALGVPGQQDLADRLVRWRAIEGTASPDAVVRTLAWLRSTGWAVSQQTFMCHSSDFAQARTVTNFPEWADLARSAGVPVSEREVDAWVAHWRAVETACGRGPAWFHWPVVLTIARRSCPGQST